MAVTLACALLAAQVGTFVHFVRVRHVSCPEHGLMLDVPATAGTRWEASRSPGWTATSDDPLRGHDHCGACLLSPRTSSATSVAPIDAAACRGQLASTVTRDREPSATRRYALAPKQSPPLG